MPLYQLDVLVDLHNNEDAFAYVNDVIAAGLQYVVRSENDEPTLIECRVSGFVPIWPEQPEQVKEDAVELMPQAVADALFPDLNEAHPELAEEIHNGN